MLEWDLSNFFVKVLSPMFFPFSTAFTVSYKFGYVVPSFSLKSTKSLISLFLLFWLSGHWVEFFTFYESLDFLLFLLMMSSFNWCLSDKMEVFDSIFLYLLSLVISFGEGSVKCWEEWILFFIWVKCSVHIC